MRKAFGAFCIFSVLWMPKSFASINLGSCNLNCKGQENGSGWSAPSNMQLGKPGKRGAIGPIGPIGPKGDRGAPCNCLNEELSPQTCTGLVPNYGVDASGIYKIYPFENSTALLAFCDLATAGGGWMLIQRRIDGSENFFRNFSDYVRGFGKINGEFWLGLATIHELTKNGEYEMRVDMEDFENETRYAQYSTFQVHSGTGYKLTIGDYEGDAGNSLQGLSGISFTTRDRDQDTWSNNCAETFKGGWWYAACHSANPNGLYLRGQHSSQRAEGVCWRAWRGYNYSLKKMEIKIRLKN